MWFSRDGIRYCYLLLSGEVSVCRVGDDFKIANFSAPALGGVAESFYPKEKFYFLAESPVEVIMSPEADVLEVITRKNLWQHIVHIQAYLIQMLGTRDVLLSGNSTYEIICNHLLMLMSEKEAFRLSTTVPRYIQQRTQLSRSSIMKILSELRKGNYITIDKGILHTINNLPKNY
ncbi:helix-turn-helix domain-containing protein [Pseudomonas lundensis]|uniref:winged helix-turn-helix transcriptional regulator n=1 Tax=Serratia proteamaculans TaxID=28151 RepID=UPI0029821EFB|nr:helix-turn-helix domain-containing protein [Serratia proteamaculans]MDW5502142.1 helix-turn-helix domain-containing protein [Serratia proteamaculans]MDW5507201.1 helix-turn-helix domain-containing protein [Pseudomonas lundensis]